MLRHGTWLGVSLGVFVLSAWPLVAQPFEAVYGPAATADAGARRVKPVAFCPGGGFIAVGTTDQPGASDIYVVRTNNLGLPLWEMTYDAQGGGQVDEGRALVEYADGSGFVLLGNTVTTVSNIVLMKIDCDGIPQWTRIYSHNAADSALVGSDLILTAFGSPLVGTNVGDLVVAGYTVGPLPNNWTDGLLFRTTAAGALIWNTTYDTTNWDQLRGLTEAVGVGGVGAGDLVAVGETFLPPLVAASQALVVRVNGNTGALGGGIQCAAYYGGIYPESFQAVTELRTFNRVGQLVMVGKSWTAAEQDELYVVRTQANPCAMLAQATIGGDPIQDPLDPHREAAADVRELLVPLNPALLSPTGSLAITGYTHGNNLGRNSEAFLLTVQPNTLVPIAGRLYGDGAGGNNEAGVSLERIPGDPRAVGFVVAGMSDSDWEGVGDPRDVYLFATDGNLRTGCEDAWSPVRVNHTWQPQVLAPVLAHPVIEGLLDPVFTAIDTHFSVCP